MAYVILLNFLLNVLQDSTHTSSKFIVRVECCSTFFVVQSPKAKSKKAAQYFKYLQNVNESYHTITSLATVTSSLIQFYPTIEI